MLICFSMKAWYVLVVVLLLVLSGAVGFFVRDVSLTGMVVEDFGEYSYTRAVCLENECIDVVVWCSGGDVVDIEPIFYLVEFGDEWEDPRGEGVSGFCD